MASFPDRFSALKKASEVTVDIFNDTDTPEQLHWHGQKVSTDVDGAAEEGTPYIPAHGQRRIKFTPNPAGFRFYHTHNRAGADLSAGQYSGQVGPVYIEPKENPGRYDREVFLVLKEFEPTLSRGGDMPQDFLSPSATDKALKETGEAAMKASLAKGMPHGYEVGYKFFTINGRMLGHGEPIRVKARRARSLSHFEWQRDGNSEPRLARPFFRSHRARWKSSPESCACSGFMARHCGAYFGHRRNESSRCLDSGRSRR